MIILISGATHRENCAGTETVGKIQIPVPFD